MIKFWKAHAYGNDFLYVPRSEVDMSRLSELARAMCDRHTGIGADGLIAYERTARGAAMTLRNSDGSHAEVSGNGVRALAALLLDEDVRPQAEAIIETDAGTKRLLRLRRSGSRQTFRSSMGVPSEPVRETIVVGGDTVSAVVLNMGNPQCVLLGPLPDEDRFLRLGRGLERHPRFPDGTNIEFAHVETPERVRIMIWERGAGPTTSSGTGSCAALVAAAAFGGAARECEVVAPGGSQHVEWLDDGVYLTGWAEVVCSGTWVVQFPRGTE